MRRGEIWWGRVPMAASGGKRRPLLIVSRDAFNQNPHYPKVMAVHVTTVERLGGPYDWEVAIPSGTAGLGRRGTVKCGEVYTLWKEHLRGPAGTVPLAIMRQVDRALAIALALPLPVPPD